jgi:hypothetical protein
MSQEETFYIEEYKSLREEITTKLKDVREFSRWGLIGLATLYSYSLSHAENRMLFWVPVGLSFAMLFHLNEEHRLVDKAGAYIGREIEPWAAGGGTPQGWVKFLYSEPTPRWGSLERWPWRIWDWSPVPMWIVLLLVTLVIAISYPHSRPPSLPSTSAQRLLAAGQPADDKPSCPASQTGITGSPGEPR